MDYSAMLQRIVRAVTFDKNFYSEAKNNPSLNTEALIVVIVATVVGSIGSFGGGFMAFALALIMSVVGYYLLSYFVTIVGRQFFQGQGAQDQVQRLIGYSWAPRVVGLLGLIPCVGWLFSLAAVLWSIAVAVVAVREAHSFDTTKAIITVVAGWLIIAVITLLLGLVFGVGMGGLGMIR